MIRSMGVAAVAAGILATSAVASSAPAPLSSSDESALAPIRMAPSGSIEKRVTALLDKMTTQEKLQQVQLLSDGQVTDADAKAGVGGVFSLTDPARIDQLQHIAVQQSRLGIPILFAYDTIHGYRTIFPVPLGAASSFDPKIARTDAKIGARETTTVGIKQIYSPMVDVSHEPRWGRIVEGNGEDPYLGSAFAAARVKGAQGDDYSQADKAVTSVKHYVAYGQPEGGRDYNTTDMSDARLRNLYLPPFKAAIDAGADTVMCSFNAINGQRVHRDPDPEEGVGLRRLHRERLHRRRRDPRLPAEDPQRGLVRTRHRGRRPGSRRQRADGRHRLGDGEHQHP
jgi:beta-glucosidase